MDYKEQKEPKIRKKRKKIKSNKKQNKQGIKRLTVVFFIFLPDFDKAAALSYVEYVCSDHECPSKSGNTLTLNSNPNLTLILTQTLVIIYPKYNANPH